MKVYLRKGRHSAYDDLIRNPPTGVQYVVPRPISKEGILSKIRSKAWAFYTLKKPPALFFNPHKADLIHSTAGMLVRNSMPWVVDVESDGSLVKFHYSNFDSRPYMKQIEELLSSEYCKTILAWTKACRTSLEHRFHSKTIQNKIEVVYPAMSPVNVERKETDSFNMLFIGNNFYTKGCRELLASFEVLKNKYDIKLDVICEVPEEFRKKHSDVRFHEPTFTRQELLTNFFAKTDLFVFPTYMDTFGMVILEALAMGIPILTTNIFAGKEIVEDAGVLIETPIKWHDSKNQFAWKNWDFFVEVVKKASLKTVVNSIVLETSKLIQDDSLRKGMGQKGKELIERGKFSIKERNKKLKRIYEKSVK